MSLLAAALNTGVSSAAPGQPREGPESVDALRSSARAILRGVEERDLTLGEARRQVELLLRDLRALAEREGWSPLERRLEVPLARPGEIGPALAEECPLFFEEEFVTLCPLDQSRSQIWGDQLLVCEFVCAPETRERR